MTIKYHSSLQNSLKPIFIIFATWPHHFWLKAVPCSLEAVLRVKKDFMDIKLSVFSNLKSLDSPKFSLLAACDLFGSEMVWASSQIIKGRLEAVVEATVDHIVNKWTFLLENHYKSLEVKGFSHDCNSSLRITSFCSIGTYGSPCMVCYVYFTFFMYL